MGKLLPTPTLLALAILVASTSAPAPAIGQSLIGGGLTALPPVRLGPNLTRNGGFESLSGNLPASWTGGAGWAVDQLVVRGGAFSYRRSTGAPTSSQPVALRKGVYTFSAWVKTDGVAGTGAAIRLQLDMRPTVNQWFTTDGITGTRDWTLYELKNLVVPQDMTVTLKLENFNNPSGTAWFDDVTLEQQLPEPVTAFLLYPNFRGMMFDDQSQALRLHAEVAPPDGDLGRYGVRATLADEATGQVLATRDAAAATGLLLELDGSRMQYGRAYAAIVSLIDRSSGAAVSTYPAYRVSKVSAATRAAMNIAADARNRILVHGRPRFVLGVYDSGGGYATHDAFWEQQIWSPTGPRRLDGLPINFYLNYWLGAAPADAMNALMTNLQKRGVMYLQTGNCFDKFPAGENFQINSSDAYVRTIGAHPGSAGYYTADECRPDQVRGAFDQYLRLRALDPDGMTFAALFGNVGLTLWRDAADVISTDPYPLFGAEPVGGYDHGKVADWTAQARQVVKDARPFMTVLQFFRATSNARWPTRTEMRNHAYMAIVEGARGLWWWSAGNGLGALNSTSTCPTAGSWCPEQQARMADLRAVVGEIAELEPVLLADDAPGALAATSNPAVKTKVKVVNGRGYVFAYNATAQPATATFTWHTGPGSVAVNAEGRTVPVSGASFSDGFGPFQAHVYVLANGGDGFPTWQDGALPSGVADSLVTAFYAQVLGRAPAIVERDAWVTYLTTYGTGAARLLARDFFGSIEQTRRTATPADRVRSLYRAALSREPSEAEVAAWAPAVVERFLALIPMFARSPEFRGLKGRTTADVLIRRLYQVALTRTPSESEVATWAAWVGTTGDWSAVARSFLGTPDYLATPRSGTEHVRMLYRALLLREPAEAEVDVWVEYLATILGQVAEGFIGSREFQRRVSTMF